MCKELEKSSDFICVGLIETAEANVIQDSRRNLYNRQRALKIDLA